METQTAALGRDVLDVAIRAVGNNVAGLRVLSLLVRNGLAVGKERTWEIEGGPTTLAIHLGMKGHVVPALILKALSNLQDVGLLTFQYRGKGPAGDKSTLSITLGSQLLPGWVFSLPKNTREEREGRELIPIPSIPPTSGGTRGAASEAMLVFALMKNLRSHSRELNVTGYADLNLPRLSLESGLPLYRVEELLKIWAFQGLFMEEREFISKSGQQELSGVRAANVMQGRKRRASTRRLKLVVNNGSQQ